MWLLKFHVAFSILCILSMHGILILFRERYERYKKYKPKKRRFSKVDKYIVLFCPVINVLVLIALVYMALISDEECNEIIEKMKSEDTDS